MDGYSSKRAVDGLVVSRKASGLILRDNVNSGDRNAQFCNRIGCNSRLNSTKSTQNGCSEKAKSVRSSFRSSSSGKEVIGSSSRPSTVASNARKSSANSRKKLSSQLDTDSSETSSVQDEPQNSELILPPGKIQRGLHPESEDNESKEVILVEEGSSSAASNTRSRRNLNQRLGSGNRDATAGSSVSRSNNHTAVNTSKHGLRNLRCSSISDVIPTTSGLSLESNLSRRKDVVKKRNPGGETSTSSSRGRKTSESSSEVRNHGPSHGINISDSRRARNWTPNRDNTGITSVRTRRSTNSSVRARLSDRGNGNNLPHNESPVEISPLPPSSTTVVSNPHVPQFPEGASARPSSFSRPSSSNGRSLRGLRPGSPAEAGIAQSLVNRDNFSRYNIEGIAEVLLALERIEQDEELSYEQLLVLETNLLLNGLSFYDQHRDMRLDIDNMSYEELLALEERMGTVSTALTEESLSKCLETSIHESTSTNDASPSLSGDKDDVKCSICQEEYIIGEDVGRLRCQHKYHIVCVQQWLRLKNWCPICKAEAEPSPSAPSSLPS